MTHQSKRILVAPLDWGLGHATRCIPIIKLLIDKGHQVSIASSGDALKLLRAEFVDLEGYELTSYSAMYSRHIPFMLNIFIQVPKFLIAISKEKKEIKKIINECEFDLIISDNRYGCRNNKVPSVFICHQINILMPLGLKWVSSIVDYFNQSMIKKFDECWIPDDHAHSLSGGLSNPKLSNCKYIGFLSRFKKRSLDKITYHVAIVLSGPEPQRSIFENKVVEQLKNFDIPCALVRGLVKKADERKTEKNITTFNYLPSDKLQEIITTSSIIICRSGYSSIMDLAILGKRVIFVPTPGQTEQEYLGKLMKEKSIAPVYSQDEFDLRQALSEAEGYAGFDGWNPQPNLLNEAIDHFLK